MTEIRRLAAEDMPAYRRLTTVVYNMRRDFSKEETPEKVPHPPEWTRGVFEGGKLVSAMTEWEFLMRFDGQSVPMIGIGGVGTLPEARKGGHVRAMFEKFLPEAYENGVIFSNLHPFSFDFYRKFGYELAHSRNEITIPAGEFSDHKLRGHFIQVFPGDDTSALNEIHKSYIADLNHGICRDYWPDNQAWKRVMRDPYADGVFLYLWRDEAGNNSGYIQYEDKLEDDEHIMYVRELAFTGRDALYGVLSIVSGLSAQFESFRWLMPTFLDPADFISEVNEIEQTIIPRDMTRVINVKAALEKMRRPGGEGSYVIAVNDEMIATNSGRYLVEYASNESRVTRTQKKADISCDIPALSQLVTGCRSLENALRTRRSRLVVHENIETLKRVFTARPQHLTEYF
jgi:predicted acetyltransferase